MSHRIETQDPTVPAAAGDTHGERSAPPRLEEDGQEGTESWLQRAMVPVEEEAQQMFGQVGRSQHRA